jgi:hypothetical protein
MSELNLHELIDSAADTEVDMNEAQSGGGDYTPPAEGVANLRFVTYIELGKQEGTYQGKPKVSDKVVLGFELHGAKWPLNEDGKAQYVEFEVNKSLNEKAGFYKLFKVMNWEGKAKIMAQLLGKDFRGRLIHRKYKRRDGKEGVAVEFYDKTQQVYTIKEPFIEDEEGNSKRVNVAPATRELSCFIWNTAAKAMWDSIYIDGEWPERKDEKTGEVTAPAKSKNKHQLAIKAAKNFPGSPIAALLEGVDDEMLNEEGRKTPEEAVAEKKAKAASVKQADQESSKPAASESKKPAKVKEPEPVVETPDSTDEDELANPDLPF